MFMLKLLDKLLDRITMYRLLLYYLIFLVAAAIGLSLLGYIHFNAANIAFSAIYLTIVCLVSNTIFSKAYGVPANIESAYITALILALIITPPTTNFGIIFLTAAGGLSMASKYVLAIKRKHIFNPAAVAVVLTAIGGGQSASWWVGTASMLPFVAIGGILVVQRIRRWSMVLTFLGASLATTVILSLTGGQQLSTTLHQIILSSALCFLAFVMLTEPLSSPSTAKYRLWYGIIVGILFAPQVHIGTQYSTPEIALVIGNIFAYIVNPKVKLLPAFTKRVKVARDTADFIFTPDQKFWYEPGQYMEWTLAHPKTDSRGNRRYFTLASSPTEPELRIGVKFYPKGSSYKKAMLELDHHSPVVAADLGGDFTLPKDPTKKLAFIAGGIGVTPYRSMIKYLIDTDTPQPITLLYAAHDPKDFAYTEIFDKGEQKLGIKTVYTVTHTDKSAGWNGQSGLITAEMIQREIPDYKERTFYISGPQPMVAAVQTILHELGVQHIKTDFFPGYA